MFKWREKADSVFYLIFELVWFGSHWKEKKSRIYFNFGKWPFVFFRSLIWKGKCVLWGKKRVTTLTTFINMNFSKTWVHIHLYLIKKDYLVSFRCLTSCTTTKIMLWVDTKNGSMKVHLNILFDHGLFLFKYTWGMGHTCISQIPTNRK